MSVDVILADRPHRRRRWRRLQRRLVGQVGIVVRSVSRSVGRIDGGENTNRASFIGNNTQTDRPPPPPLLLLPPLPAPLTPRQQPANKLLNQSISGTPATHSFTIDFSVQEQYGDVSRRRLSTSAASSVLVVFDRTVRRLPSSPAERQATLRTRRTASFDCRRRLASRRSVPIAARRRTSN